MKKTIKSLLAIAIGAFAFTACSDVPEPEGYNPRQGNGLVTYVPEGTGTATDPYNVAGVIEGTKDLPKGSSTATDIYATGYVAEIGEFNSSFGNITFYITDNPEGKSTKFYVYRCLGLGGDKFASADAIKLGDIVTVCGKVKNYNGTFEYDQGSYLVRLNDQTKGGGSGGGGEGGDTPTPTGPNLLTNGDFETWADGLPTHWKSASAAGNATLTQSSDAHGGSSSVSVGFDASTNKRMAYEEITLKAGTYTFSVYAKSTTTDPSQTQVGYVTIKADGSADSQGYKYGGYVSLNNTSWTQVSSTFTLSADTKVCLVLMNPKTSSYATAQNILVDDASLVTSDGGIVEGGGESGGGNTPAPTGNHGTEAAPLTVAQAIAVIDAETTASDCYVKGTICQIDSYNSTYGSITYWISDDGGTTTKLEVYGGLNVNGAKFTAKEDLTTGKVVVVKGNLKKYGEIYEFDKNNVIVSIQ